jgi:phage/plasmid-like protein (TIGR03299 family)
MTPNIDLLERMKVIAARINSGKDSYAGRLDAWHNLGVVTGKFATWEELLKSAKADFEVIKKQLQWMGKDVEAWGTFRFDREIPKGLEEKAIRIQRKNGDVGYLSFIGSVGQDYTPIQHTSGFELLDRLVNSIDGAHYETMGTLDHGALVWGQVNPNFKIRVGDDESDVYLTFQTSHDGSKAFDIFETGIRSVCRNTFRMASLKKLGSTLRVKHTKNSAKRVDSLKAEIDEIKNVAMTMEERLQFLSKRKVTRESLTKVMDRLFPKKQTEDGEESSTRRDNNIADVLRLYDYNDGDTFREQRGTAYNLWNAVTEYTDHFRSTKNDMRAESAVFGSGDKLKNTAFSVLLEEAMGMPEKGESIQVETLGLVPRMN